MQFPKRITIENRFDLYRGTTIVQHSPEHVVQAGLGGVLEVEGLINHETNTQFGGTIDKAITESLPLFRSMIGLRTRRGDPIRVEAESGDYDLLGDIPVRKKPTTKGPPWTVEERSDGTRIIKVTAENMERAAELARHASRAHKAPGNKPAKIEASSVRTFVPTISHKLELGGPVDLRAVAKSCVNALAVHLTPRAVLGGPFQQIRDYVLYGVDHCAELLGGGMDPHPAYACWDNRPELFPALPKDCNLGPIDHRLVIRGCSAEKTVYATAELFGYLPVSVLLTDDWTGAEFCWGLVTDPRPDGNGHWRGLLDIRFRPALSADAVMAHATNIDGLRTANEKLVAALTQLAKDRTMNDLLTQCLTEALGQQDGRPVTEDMVNNAASKVAERFTELMFRFESRTRVEPPPDLLPPD
jgi:hypothetical protein